MIFLAQYQNEYWKCRPHRVRWARQNVPGAKSAIRHSDL